MWWMIAGALALLFLMWWTTRPAKPYEGFGFFQESYEVAGSYVSNGE